jgi:D-3-phosphoglycerate dehydrogenase
VSTVAVLDAIGDDVDVERRILEAQGHNLVQLGIAPDLDQPILGTVAGVLTTDGVVSADLLDRMPECRVVTTYGVGYDNIDVLAATSRGIVVTNVPDYCTNEVADHTLALLLALERRIVAGDRLTREGGWGAEALGPMRRLRDRTLGLIGFGRIGRAVAVRAEAFGMRVIGFDPAAPPTDPRTVPTLTELLERSDIVSLHAPLTAATHRLVDRAALEQVRQGTRLINTSRGGLLDLDAALSALDAGRLSGLALDVYPSEPPDVEALRGRDDVVLSPHVAFYSTDAIEEARSTAAREVVAVLGGMAAQHRVN